jgi:hypothetical protein
MLLNKEVAITATCVYVTDFVLREKYLVKRNGKENYSGNLISTIYVTLGVRMLLLVTRKPCDVCMGDVRATC